MDAIFRSRDGSPIAYTVAGSGQPLILVDGAFCHRRFGANIGLAKELEKDFTVITYDRRGRGESGNTLPYSPEREWEDLEALVEATGGDAFVYGISSGAALVMDAAQAGLPAQRLAVYEAPFITDSSRAPLPVEFASRIQGLVEQGKPGHAVQEFLKTGIGLPTWLVALLGIFPAWKSMKSMAHTLPYDIRILGDATRGKPLDPQRWHRVQSPVLVMAGTRSPGWIQQSMQDWALALSKAEFQSLKGQNHQVNPRVMARTLTQWLNT